MEKRITGLEWLQLLIWIAAFQAIGFLFGLVTQANIDPWYLGLNKSSLTPPGIAFSIVWPILYVILAIVGWALARHQKQTQLKPIYHLYLLQMLMNWAWTPLFFQLKWIGFSFIWLVVLTCLNGLIIWRIQNKIRWIAIILLPYFLWLIFATYLNGTTWLLN